MVIDLTFSQTVCRPSHNGIPTLEHLGLEALAMGLCWLGWVHDWIDTLAVETLHHLPNCPMPTSRASASDRAIRARPPLAATRCFQQSHFPRGRAVGERLDMGTIGTWPDQPEART